MVSIVLTWLIVAWGALSCIYMLRCAWRRFPKRDVDDVIPFLYPVDISLAESLLDPAAEFEFRWKLQPPQFREAQRKRMGRARHACHAARGIEREHVFFGDEQVRAMIVGHATQEQIRQYARGEGMRTLQDAVCDLVDDGKTTIAEAMRTVYVL